MKFRAVTRHVIPFHDVDIMHVAWHGHYFKYFEMARTELARSLGIDWPDAKKLGWAMPIIKVDARYRQSLLYGRAYEIEAACDEPLQAAMDVRYTIRDAETGVVCATGATRQAYVEIETLETSLALPEVIEGKFKDAWAKL